MDRKTEQIPQDLAVNGYQIVKKCKV